VPPEPLHLNFLTEPTQEHTRLPIATAFYQQGQKPAFPAGLLCRKIYKKMKGVTYGYTPFSMSRDFPEELSENPNSFPETALPKNI
jgi:hypothetical protein